MTFFERRSRTKELMDIEEVSFEDFEACLKELEWLNQRTFAYPPTLSWLSRIAPRGSRLSILDVGSGYGDMLRRIWDWSRRADVEVAMIGVDLNPWAREAAMRATPPEAPIRYVTADVYDLPEEPVDVVISSLFAHHLEDEHLVAFMRWMDDHARVGWFINDLHRHSIPYFFLKALFAAAPFHRFVVHDGPVSVSRAFKRWEWELFLDVAEIDRDRVDIRWRAPFRWAVGTKP